MEYVSERVMASGRPSGTAMTRTVMPIIKNWTKFETWDAVKASPFLK
jgi:hypothetical protein